MPIKKIKKAWSMDCVPHKEEGLYPKYTMKCQLTEEILTLEGIKKKIWEFVTPELDFGFNTIVYQSYYDDELHTAFKKGTSCHIDDTEVRCRGEET